MGGSSVFLSHRAELSNVFSPFRGQGGQINLVYGAGSFDSSGGIEHVSAVSRTRPCAAVRPGQRIIWMRRPPVEKRGRKAVRWSFWLAAMRRVSLTPHRCCARLVILNPSARSAVERHEQWRRLCDGENQRIAAALEVLFLISRRGISSSFCLGAVDIFYCIQQQSGGLLPEFFMWNDHRG